MRKMVAILAACFACAGCLSVGWESPMPPTGAAPDSLTALLGFEQMLPRRLRMATTVAFQHGFRRLTGLGLLDADAAEQSCSLVATTRKGALLFKIVCTNGESLCRFAVSPFKENSALTDAVAADVQRMCFSLVPPGDAASQSESNVLVARSEAGAEATEWVFGSGSVLLEKRFFRAGKLTSQVGYYDYSLERGRRVAHRMALHNVQYDYWLTVELQDLRVCD
jgi:hypothetical protein